MFPSRHVGVFGAPSADGVEMPGLVRFADDLHVHSFSYPPSSAGSEVAEVHPFASVDMTDAPLMAGPLPYDILGRVFSFLPVDVTTMNAVCLVCTGWNFYAERLPQWSDVWFRDPAVASDAWSEISTHLSTFRRLGTPPSPEPEHPNAARLVFVDTKRELRRTRCRQRWFDHARNTLLALLLLTAMSAVTFALFVGLVALGHTVAYQHVAVVVCVEVAAIGCALAAWIAVMINLELRASSFHRAFLSSFVLLWWGLPYCAVGGMYVFGAATLQRPLDDLRIGHGHALGMECGHAPSPDYVDWVRLEEPELWRPRDPSPITIHGVNVTVFAYHGTRCNATWSWKNTTGNGTYAPLVAVFGSGAFMANLTGPTTLRTIYDRAHYGNDPGGVSHRWVAGDAWRVDGVPLVEDAPGDVAVLDTQYDYIESAIGLVKWGVLVYNSLITVHFMPPWSARVHYRVFWAFLIATYCAPLPAIGAGVVCMTPYSPRWCLIPFGCNVVLLALGAVYVVLLALQACRLFRLYGLF